MKIAHCQFESWNADFARNLRRFEEDFSRADAVGPDIVGFNERRGELHEITVASTDGVRTGDAAFFRGGEILILSRRQAEDFHVAEIDPARESDRARGLSEFAWSDRDFLSPLEAAAQEAGARRMGG